MAPQASNGQTGTAPGSAAALPPPVELPQPAKHRQSAFFEAFERRQTTARSAPRRCRFSCSPIFCGPPGASTARPGPFGAPGRTAASASNSQEIDLYVALSTGSIVTMRRPCLEPVVAGDFRAGALTPGQRGIDAKAPVQLIFVVDLHRLTHTRASRSRGCTIPKCRNPTISSIPASSPATSISSPRRQASPPGSTIATRPGCTALGLGPGSGCCSRNRSAIRRTNEGGLCGSTTGSI